MPNFHYIALDQNGQEIAGVIDAVSDAEAINALRSQQLYPTQVVQEGKGDTASIKKRARTTTAKAKGKAAVKATATAKVKGKTLMIFTRQLATLIDSGLPLLRGLTVLGRQEPLPVMKSTINTLADAVQTGSTFSESLQQYPRIFNKLYVNMVKAGELGGVLEIVLNRLAEYQEKAQKLKNKVVAAMVYPIIVMFIAVAIMIFLMLVIVPKFEGIFKDMLQGKPLPWLTQVVIGMSRWIGANFVYLAIGAFGIVVAWKIFSSTKGGRVVIDKAKLRMPIFGDVQRKTAISRFTRTLGTLVTSGVPILQALNITRETAGNVVVSDAINKVHDAVKEGESMVAPLDGSGVFPPMVISMVDVGEETGALDNMLYKVADIYDEEVAVLVEGLISMLEPLMVVVLGLIVGFIVIALFLPLVKLLNELS
ncbi:MAG: type II secretion system F family protein [Planctomycetaceae bacterium]|nr:type II secretion system F family protein [Planctomycetaceae bacterium]